MAHEHDERYSELIRCLVSCQQQATRLGLGFLAQLISLAVMETALQWDGGPIPSDPKMQLDRLLRLKIKVALAQAGSNILPMSSALGGGSKDE